jgi:hypothetical protein
MLWFEGLESGEEIVTRPRLLMTAVFSKRNQLRAGTWEFELESI